MSSSTAAASAFASNGELAPGKAFTVIAVQSASSSSKSVCGSSISHAKRALPAAAMRSVQTCFASSTTRHAAELSGSVAQITPQFSAGALKAAADDLESSAAWRVVEDAKQVWAERIAAAGSARLAWLIELPQTDLLELLALCTAMTVNALPGAGAAFDANALAAAVELDMADWWEPTPARYLNHVPKSQIITALEEAGPGLTDGGLEAMKKEALVACASARLAGRRWLPLPLRKPSV